MTSNSNNGHHHLPPPPPPAHYAQQCRNSNDDDVNDVQQQQQQQQTTLLLVKTNKQVSTELDTALLSPSPPSPPPSSSSSLSFVAIINNNNTTTTTTKTVAAVTSTIHNVINVEDAPTTPTTRTSSSSSSPIMHKSILVNPNDPLSQVSNHNGCKALSSYSFCIISSSLLPSLSPSLPALSPLSSADSSDCISLLLENNKKTKMFQHFSQPLQPKQLIRIRPKFKFVDTRLDSQTTINRLPITFSSSPSSSFFTSSFVLLDISHNDSSGSDGSGYKSNHSINVTNDAIEQSVTFSLPFKRQRLQPLPPASLSTTTPPTQASSQTQSPPSALSPFFDSLDFDPNPTVQFSCSSFLSSSHSQQLKLDDDHRQTQQFRRRHHHYCQWQHKQRQQFKSKLLSPLSGAERRMKLNSQSINNWSRYGAVKLAGPLLSIATVTVIAAVVVVTAAADIVADSGGGAHVVVVTSSAHSARASDSTPSLSPSFSELLNFSSISSFSSFAFSPSSSSSSLSSLSKSLKMPLPSNNEQASNVSYATLHQWKRKNLSMSTSTSSALSPQKLFQQLPYYTHQLASNPLPLLSPSPPPPSSPLLPSDELKMDSITATVTVSASSLNGLMTEPTASTIVVSDSAVEVAAGGLTNLADVDVNEAKAFQINKLRKMEKSVMMADTTTILTVPLNLVTTNLIGDVISPSSSASSFSSYAQHYQHHPRQKRKRRRLSLHRTTMNSNNNNQAFVDEAFMLNNDDDDEDDEEEEEEEDDDDNGDDGDANSDYATMYKKMNQYLGGKNKKGKIVVDDDDDDDDGGGGGGGGGNYEQLSTTVRLLPQRQRLPLLKLTTAATEEINHQSPPQPPPSSSSSYETKWKYSNDAVGHRKRRKSMQTQILQQRSSSSEIEQRNLSTDKRPTNQVVVGESSSSSMTVDNVMVEHSMHSSPNGTNNSNNNHRDNNNNNNAMVMLPPLPSASAYDDADGNVDVTTSVATNVMLNSILAIPPVNQTMITMMHSNGINIAPTTTTITTTTETTTTTTLISSTSAFVSIDDGDNDDNEKSNQTNQFRLLLQMNCNTTTTNQRPIAQQLTLPAPASPSSSPTRQTPMIWSQLKAHHGNSSKANNMKIMTSNDDDDINEQNGCHDGGGSGGGGDDCSNSNLTTINYYNDNNNTTWWQWWMLKMKSFMKMKTKKSLSSSSPLTVMATLSSSPSSLPPVPSLPLPQPWQSPLSSFPSSSPPPPPPQPESVPPLSLPLTQHQQPQVFEVLINEEERDLPKKLFQVKALMINDGGNSDNGGKSNSSSTFSTPSQATAEKKKQLQLQSQSSGPLMFILSGNGVDYEHPEQSKFAINAFTGELFLIAPVDRDPPNGRELWRLNITAEDDAGAKVNGSVAILVRVRDINDNAPHFTQELFHANVSENLSSGIDVIKLTAIDRDVDSIVRYSIEMNRVNSDSELIFDIDELSGVVSTAVCCLDRESIDQYTIKVCATDRAISGDATFHWSRGGLGSKGKSMAAAASTKSPQNSATDLSSSANQTASCTSVVIDVMDENDEPPRFIRDRYHLTLPDGVNELYPGRLLLNTSVMDGDLPATNRFACRLSGIIRFAEQGSLQQYKQSSDSMNVSLTIPSTASSSSTAPPSPSSSSSSSLASAIFTQPMTALRKYFHCDINTQGNVRVVISTQEYTEADYFYHSLMNEFDSYRQASATAITMGHQLPDWIEFQMTITVSDIGLFEHTQVAADDMSVALESHLTTAEFTMKFSTTKSINRGNNGGSGTFWNNRSKSYDATTTNEQQKSTKQQTITSNSYNSDRVDRDRRGGHLAHHDLASGSSGFSTLGSSTSTSSSSSSGSMFSLDQLFDSLRTLFNLNSNSSSQRSSSNIGLSLLVLVLLIAALALITFGVIITIRRYRCSGNGSGKGKRSRLKTKSHHSKVKNQDDVVDEVAESSATLNDRLKLCTTATTLVTGTVNSGQSLLLCDENDHHHHHHHYQQQQQQQQQIMDNAICCMTIDGGGGGGGNGGASRLNDTAVDNIGMTSMVGEHGSDGATTTTAQLRQECVEDQFIDSNGTTTNFGQLQTQQQHYRQQQKATYNQNQSQHPHQPYEQLILPRVSDTQMLATGDGTTGVGSGIFCTTSTFGDLIGEMDSPYLTLTDRSWSHHHHPHPHPPPHQHHQQHPLTCATRVIGIDNKSPQSTIDSSTGTDPSIATSCTTVSSSATANSYTSESVSAAAAATTTHHLVLLDSHSIDSPTAPISHHHHHHLFGHHPQHHQLDNPYSDGGGGGNIHLYGEPTTNTAETAATTTTIALYDLTHCLPPPTAQQQLSPSPSSSTTTTTSQHSPLPDTINHQRITSDNSSNSLLASSQQTSQTTTQQHHQYHTPSPQSSQLSTCSSSVSSPQPTGNFLLITSSAASSSSSSSSHHRQHPHPHPHSHRQSSQY